MAPLWCPVCLSPTVKWLSPSSDDGSIDCSKAEANHLSGCKTYDLTFKWHHQQGKADPRYSPKEKKLFEVMNSSSFSQTLISLGYSSNFSSRFQRSHVFRSSSPTQPACSEPGSGSLWSPGSCRCFIPGRGAARTIITCSRTQPALTANSPPECIIRGLLSSSSSPCALNAPAALWVKYFLPSSPLKV